MLDYLCSGITSVQYKRLCELADFRVLTDHFRVQSSLAFSAIIKVLANESVELSLLDKVEVSKDRNNQSNGITVTNDVRHHCKKNSYHTDHIPLGMTTNKVINMQHITKLQERSTQKHEAIGCESMYTDFKKRHIKVYLHAQDRHFSVNKAISDKGNIQNCNERWHAIKPAAKE